MTTDTLTPEARSRRARAQARAYDAGQIPVATFTIDREAFGGPVLVGHVRDDCPEVDERVTDAAIADAVPCPHCVLGYTAWPAETPTITLDAEVRNVRPVETSTPGGPGMSPDAALAHAWDFVDTVLVPQDRKADIADMTHALVRGAQVYLSRYTGDFTFLVNIKVANRKLTDGQAKGVLNCMKGERLRSRRSDVPAPSSEVPEGHYAVVPDNGDNDLVFYRVDRPTEGRWAGRVFVKHIIGGRPDSPVARASVQRVLDQIAEQGIEHSAVRYGVELGQCYACNRTLTDQESRELGIGPECRKRH